jgi:hypothetical protein
VFIQWRTLASRIALGARGGHGELVLPLGDRSGFREQNPILQRPGSRRPGRSLDLDQFIAVALKVTDSGGISRGAPWDPIHLLEWIDHAHSIAADEGVRADAVEMAYFATAEVGANRNLSSRMPLHAPLPRDANAISDHVVRARRAVFGKPRQNRAGIRERDLCSEN